MGVVRFSTDEGLRLATLELADEIRRTLEAQNTWRGGMLVSRWKHKERNGEVRFRVIQRKDTTLFFDVTVRFVDERILRGGETE